MQLLITLHRYLGIAAGWLIAAWCVSGIVMIYVPYPAYTRGEHIAGLPPLDLDRCCELAAGRNRIDTLPATDFSIEMRSGIPVLTLPDPFGAATRIALTDGRVLPAPGPDDVTLIADAHTAHWPGRGPVTMLGAQGRDQWTIGYQRPGQTLWRVALGDAAGTQWYISSLDGSVVQATTATERFWNYPGSVLHWLYFTPLRALGPVWANIVIYSSLTALVLSVIGLWLGVARLRLSPGGISPFRGLMRWHHIAGLAAGLFAATWLLSGMLSMNPWGLLAGSGPDGERERLEGDAPDFAALGRTMATWRDLELPPGTTYLEAAPLAGELFVLAHTRDGQRHRLDANLRPARLSADELEAAAARLAATPLPPRTLLMTAPDAYYYDHKTSGAWPVYRVIAGDTRYYLDAVSGTLLDRIDGSRVAYRWLFTALHSLDFAAIVRVRPLWDTLMIVLLAAVTFVSLSGSWLGIRYLGRLLGARRTH